MAKEIDISGVKRPPDINGDNKKEKLASFALMPETMTGVIGKRYMTTTGMEEMVNESDVINRNQVAVDRVKNNDLSDLETMLTTQALLLNGIFNDMAGYAASNKGEYLKATQTYLNMALKAQSQCRCTVEAINEIKNPRSLTITKQANIAEQQIVNNGKMNTDSHVGEKANEPNELLTEVKHEKVDSRRTTTTKRANKAVEAMGAVNRRKNRKGKV